MRSAESSIYFTSGGKRVPSAAFAERIQVKPRSHRQPTQQQVAVASTNGVDYAGIAACILAGVFVLSLSWFKLSSLDIGYHVAYGEHFLKTGEIVGKAADPFLYPETGVPFVNANWGSQVLMAFVFRLGGDGGLFALRIGLIAVICGAMAVVVRSLSGGWTAVGWAWALAACGAYERFSMRPELFSYALMMIQLAIWSRGVTTWKPAAILVATQLVWANLHSYFLVGILIGGCFWCDAAWGFLERKLRAADEQPILVRRFRLASISIGLMVVVCMVHPWGIRGAAFPLRTLSFLQDKAVMGGAAGDAAQSAWSEISEFQSPFSFAGQRINRYTIYASCMLLALTAAAMARLAYLKQVGLLFVLLLMIAMSTQMRRNVAQFALAAAPLCAVAIGSIARLRSAAERPRTALSNASASMLAILCIAGSWQVATGSVYFGERRVTREFGTGFHERTFPIEAMNWLAKQEALQPRMFVDYFTSSNVLPWLPERYRLYVDTNTFAYKDETLRAAFDLGFGKIPHQPFFDQFGINVVLLHCGPDTQMLVRNLTKDDGNWALVYVDPTAVIFVRRIQSQVRVILDHPMAEDRVVIGDWIRKTRGAPAARALSLGAIVNVPMSLGWWKSATTICDEAIRLEPSYDEARHYLGVASLNLGNKAARDRDYDAAIRYWKTAKACFDRVLESNPDHAEARQYRDVVTTILSSVRS